MKSSTIKKAPATCLDEPTLDIVRKLDVLLLQSRQNNLATINNILSDAKERIALWAACDNYNDSRAEKLVSQMRFETALFMAMQFLAKFALLGDDQLKRDIFEYCKKASGKSLKEIT